MEDTGNNKRSFYRMLKFPMPYQTTKRIVHTFKERELACETGPPV
jgi:hypothetical protein